MDLTTLPRALKTTDLYLRPLSMADAEGMFAMLSDPQSMKYWKNWGSNTKACSATAGASTASGRTA